MKAHSSLHHFLTFLCSPDWVLIDLPQAYFSTGNHVVPAIAKRNKKIASSYFLSPCQTNKIMLQGATFCQFVKHKISLSSPPPKKKNVSLSNQHFFEQLNDVQTERSIFELANWPRLKIKTTGPPAGLSNRPVQRVNLADLSCLFYAYCIMHIIT